ncbi:MAG TPA: hypothetical protein VFE33_01565 [Thermoanaerobaculia bacterium]|nr:hypothetical protein [Thermoanaerobaculia bacterium]
MKKYLWLVALVLASSLAVPVAADPAHAQQDQAFVHQLVQSISPAPATMSSPVLAESSSPFAPPAVYCSGFYCYTDTDCWTHCIGGEGASFCNRALHNCVPY